MDYDTLGMPTLEEFLTVDEVAAMARVSPKTVRRWEKAGRLPAVRIDAVVRFRRVDVDRLLSPQAS
jgi:excisionase family DNA binding protein